MKISFCCADTAAPVWLAALQQALPQAQVSAWSPGAALADYAVVWGPPQQFFDEQTQLKAVFNAGAGVDALLRLRLPPQTLLVRLQDAGMAVQMAEYVCHAVVGYFRELHAVQADMAAGVWRQRPPRGRSEFAVGVMGLGVLGTRVAQALVQFDYPVLGWSRTPKALPGVHGFAGAAQWSEFLRQTQVLVCLLPLTPQTENILCAENLRQLPRGAYLINVARGAHLVDDDLLALLDSGHLAGATLDVFRTEPLPPTHPFWRHPRIRLTPHTSARTLLDESVAQIAHNIGLLECGQTPPGVVRTSQGY